MDSSHSDINWQTAPPQVRNLMDSFNAAENILEGVNENIQEASLSHLKDSTGPTNIKKNNLESNIAGANETNIDEDDDDDDPLQCRVYMCTIKIQWICGEAIWILENLIKSVRSVRHACGMQNVIINM